MKTIAPTDLAAAAKPGLRNRMGEWMNRIRERQELRNLDERSLRDIGLTQADVVWEARKPFWQA